MRTLRRPMFRGGTTGTGITSGLDVPRQGYAHEPGHVVQDDWRKKKLRDVFGGDMTIEPVSYTHLTLPTIYSV